MTEEVYLNGNLKDTWQETHDNAGRRTALTELNYASKPFGYVYQADNSLTETTFNSNTFQYAYGTDGLLSSRTTPWNTQNIVSRDPVGRITEEKQTVGGTVILDEVPTWRPDSTQSNLDSTRSGTGAWNESRGYTYDSRGHVLTESYAPASGQSASLTYQGVFSK